MDAQETMPADKRMPPDNNVCQKRFAHFFELIYLYPANYLRKISETLSQRVNATVIVFPLQSRFLFKVSLKL